MPSTDILLILCSWPSHCGTRVHRDHYRLGQRWQASSERAPDAPKHCVTRRGWESHI